MRCDIVIATWNAVPMTRIALESIRQQANFSYRLILVDNSTEEDARAWFREIAQTREFGDTLLIQNEANVGWLKATNIGLRHVDAEYVCLLNNDVICGSDWLRRCVDLMQRETDIGIVNPRGNERSENIRVTDVNEYAKKVAADFSKQYTELHHCSGFCMVVRSDLFQRFGLLDEIFEGGYYEDNDFCHRVQHAGFRCAQCDDAFVLHLVSQSFSKLPSEQKRQMIDRNREICKQRWGEVNRQLLLLTGPSVDGGALIEEIRKSRTYLIDGQNIPDSVRKFRHQHLIMLHPWRYFAWPFFLYKALYLAYKKRIDQARIVF